MIAIVVTVERPAIRGGCHRKLMDYSALFMLSPVEHHITTWAALIQGICKGWVMDLEDCNIGCGVNLLSSSQLQHTEELLRQQQFLEVYLEGTRSRSGKPSPAHAGMLSIVVEVLCANSITDVLIVPVGISYERIIEGNYNSEQLVMWWYPTEVIYVHSYCHAKFLESKQTLTRRI